MARSRALAGLALAFAMRAGAQEVEFFEAKIRPVLVKSCYPCHSSDTKTPMAGLYLDSRSGIRTGGTSGPAIVPGKPQESLLLRAIRHDGRKMPPGGKLADGVIADFEKWIAMGAPDPREGAAPPPKAAVIDIEKGRKFWAFQPITNPPVPQVVNEKWSAQPIDRFLLARMEQKGLAPVADADRATWIRRVTFDLTGLPPTPEAVDAFARDRHGDAYAKVVDRLLASDRFGERWGRHWLDVARYAESIGRGRNYAFPFAWRYRDYVIDAFNKDKPFDRFIREQIAGDLMPARSARERNQQLIATGFLTLGSNDASELNAAVYRMDTVDEQINATTRAVLALTVGCARCHDHKFDPIPTTDYYAMAGIFYSTEMLSGIQRRPRDVCSYFNLGLLGRLSYDEDLPQPVHLADPAKRKRWEELQVEHKEEMIAVTKISGAGAGLRSLQACLKVMEEMDQYPLPPDLVMSVREGGVEDCKVNIAGDPKKTGPLVPRGFIRVVSKPGESPALDRTHSGRAELADWLTRRENPLTARVAVNRIWHQMFGRGIVATVDNFGMVGERPTNPELLDYLATRFMDEGWSTKKMIREIALSRAYRLASSYSAANGAIDPDNTLVWHMSQRRLEGEAIRDAILMVSGELDLTPPVASPVMGFRMRYDVGRKYGTFPEDYSITRRYRSVYVPMVRDLVPEMFEIFDFPEPSETKGLRDVTTVPTQALFLLNSKFVMEQAKHAAEKALEAGGDGLERVRGAYRAALGRPPDADELKQSLELLKKPVDVPAGADPRLTAWSRLYQVLFASAEFRYRN